MTRRARMTQLCRSIGFAWLLLSTSSMAQTTVEYIHTDPLLRRATHPARSQMKNSIPGYLARVAIGLSFLCGAGALPSIAAAEPYGYCVLFTPRACFGIGPADQIIVSSPADFVTYDVLLSSEIRGRIYSGMHAKIRGAPFEDEAEKCIDDDRDCAFLVRSPDRVWGYCIAGGSEMEVIFEHPGSDDIEELTAFLRGFRRCTKDGNSLYCKAESVFDAESIQRL